MALKVCAFSIIIIIIIIIIITVVLIIKYRADSISSWYGLLQPKQKYTI